MEVAFTTLTAVVQGLQSQLTALQREMTEMRAEHRAHAERMEVAAMAAMPATQRADVRHARRAAERAACAADEQLRIAALVGETRDTVLAAAKGVHTAVPALIANHSMLWRHISEDEPAADWFGCLPTSPETSWWLPAERCADLLALLAGLHADGPLPPFNICFAHERPLVPRLATLFPSDRADLRRLADFLILPPSLSLLIDQHEAAWALMEDFNPALAAEVRSRWGQPGPAGASISRSGSAATATGGAGAGAGAGAAAVLAGSLASDSGAGGAGGIAAGAGARAVLGAAASLGGGFMPLTPTMLAAAAAAAAAAGGAGAGAAAGGAGAAFARPQPAQAAQLSLAAADRLRTAISQSTVLAPLWEAAIAASPRIPTVAWAPANPAMPSLRAMREFQLGLLGFARPEQLSWLGALVVGLVVAKRNFPVVTAGWLRKAEASWGTAGAAYMGDIEAIKTLETQGWGVDSRTAAGAAEGGAIECLEWLKERGCPIDDEVRSMRHMAHRRYSSLCCRTLRLRAAFLLAPST